MEELKRKRTQLRRAFTKMADALEKALSEPVTAEAELSITTDCADELFEMEAAIRDLWCSGELFNEHEFTEDQDRALEYKVRWSKLQTRARQAERQREEAESTTAKTIKSCPHGKRVNMPKLEITKFNGEIKKWLLFWGQFKKIDGDPDIDEADKFQYLLQCMEVQSSARQLVESYPPCAENYRKALGALKARFARDDVLIETYVRGLLTLMQDKNQTSAQTKDLPMLYDSLQTHLQALETLGVTKDKYASILFPMVESALPDEVLRAWNRHRADGRHDDDLARLVDFLRQEVESEERILLARQGVRNVSTPEPNTPTCCFVAGEKSEKRSIVCIWCDKDTHCSAECIKASKMTLEQRVEHIKSKKACAICLRQNHPTKKCKSYPKCLFCKKRHSTLMCPDIAEQGGNKKQEDTKANNLHCELKSTTLLQTIVVKVFSNDEMKMVCARALIDSGAQRSYITKDLAEELNMRPTRKEVLSHCLFGGKEEKPEERRIYDIVMKSVIDDFRCQLSVVEQKIICGYVPKVNCTKLMQELGKKGVTLTDVADSDIKLLIGADYSGLLMTGEFLQVSDGLTAVRTKMGWTVQGPTTGIYMGAMNSLHFLTRVDIPDLWSLESLGIKDPAEQSTQGEHDKRVLQDFEESIRVNSEGRYEVSLPWRDVPRPETNYRVVEKRLIATTNRLKQLGKIEQYGEVFKQWLESGIIEVAPEQSVKGHYMPHHAVIKESSQTTKIRPVFDASAKDANGISLNSCLEKGVNLLEQIPQLLIDFRKEAIGVTADIAKAFLQISLRSEERDYLRFLWWTNLNDWSEGTTTYRHKRVVFGVASSPFHLIATINHHLDKSPQELKGTAEKLKKSFYVDNCVTSVKSEEALHKFISESKQLMLNGKFDLRGWVSGPVKICRQTKSMSVLGVVWNIDDDSLRCNAGLMKNIDGKWSKRTLLSVVQRVFDPIGVTCPTTIIPKMIIQKTWPRKLTWDEELPTDLADEFKAWLEQAHLINECTIPRRLSEFSLEESENTLHVFCDASKEAYAVCIFLRTVYNGKVNLSLVLAKSRVTPINKVTNITIPRLELIAATLATRLAKTAINSLNLTNCMVHYWTDSSVVLTWIKGEGDWGVFVNNRIKEIRLATTTSSWRHVPGNKNPADLPSRGTSPKGLLDSRWWAGPGWLKLDQCDWPVTAFEAGLSEVDEEQYLRSKVDVDGKESQFETKETICSATACSYESLIDGIQKYFSKYTKIIRTIAWVLRYIHNIRHANSKRKGELSYGEFERAERKVVKLIQEANQENINKDGGNATKYIDNEGIMRIKTKLTLSPDFPETTRTPYVLPAKDPVVKLMVRQRHELLQHVGANQLIVDLRTKFWIIGIRRLVKSTIANCVICKRFRSKPSQAPTAPLPTERLISSAPFQNTGVDLAGPLLLRSGEKCWIVLYTCAVYRAVHLEITRSLSTEAFIMTLRRFIARRGRADIIMSDQGTNFHGTKTLLSSLDWEEVQRQSTVRRIQWRMNAPAAAWWGGFWERLIGVMKNLLRRIIGKASLTYDELETTLCECEAVMNGRPLTYINDDKGECLEPLTPAHFLQPASQAVTEVGDLDKVDSNSLNSRLKFVQKLREQFTGRFKSEYLTLLVQRGKEVKSNLREGDIVLIETAEKRIKWPLGQIQKLIAGRDGVERTAEVRTATGVRIRPVQRLFNLEIPDSTSLPTQRSVPSHAESETITQTSQTETGKAIQPQLSRYGRKVTFPSRYDIYHRL